MNCKFGLIEVAIGFEFAVVADEPARKAAVGRPVADRAAAHKADVRRTVVGKAAAHTVAVVATAAGMSTH